MPFELAALILTNLALVVLMVFTFRELRQSKRASAATPPSDARATYLQNLLHALTDSVCVLDRDGSVRETFADSAAMPIRRVLERLPRDVGEALLGELRAAIDEARRRQFRFVLDDRWFVVEIAPLPPTGRDRLAAVQLRDVSDERRSASRVDRLAARNEAILRSSMDGFFVVGDDYRFLEVNDAFCSMIGYTAEELLQKRISDLEVRDNPRGLTASANVRTGLNHFSTSHRHKDGHLVQLEISVIMLRDEGRKILVGFARDVTERRRAEERIRQINERFESLVVRMPLGYIVWTPDFHVQEWNPAAAAIFGYAANEAGGRHAFELIVPDDSRAVVGKMWNRLLAGEPNGHAVHPALRRDGERITCEWFNTVLRDAAGRVECVATLLRDVSERERLQAELRQSQKLESLGVLAGGVAHDFNNFLVSILCNASLAIERRPSDPEVVKQLQKIINASRRASELTRQMLAYSGRASYDVHDLNLTALVDEMADFMRAALPKTVSLVLNRGAELPMVQADSGQVQQVIMNLLINAAEAIAPNSGVVTITTAAITLGAADIAAEFPDQNLVPGRYVSLEVQDTGCGMSAETLSRIFDPFFTTKFTGRGLGLAAILGIMKAHRGGIRVRSKLQEGTRFVVVFPAAAARPARTRAARALPAVVPQGATVLVIDDEEDIREVVQAVFENRGVRVLTAASGPAGIELFRQHAGAIDVVLLDMTMPGMSGDAVFREIVALNPHARVVLSSGYSEQETATRFNDPRLAGFVQKPYTADVLVEKVGAAMQA